jgi:hypothetical protein
VIIAGVAGGVGGILLGTSVAALAFISRGRRKKEEPYSGLQVSEPIPIPRPSNDGAMPTIPDSPPVSPAVPEDRSIGEESGSLDTWQSQDRISLSPDLRARWTGGTRYDAVSPVDVATEWNGPKRVATLEFRPRVDSEIPFNS